MLPTTCLSALNMSDGRETHSSILHSSRHSTASVLIPIFKCDRAQHYPHSSYSSSVLHFRHNGEFWSPVGEPVDGEKARVCPYERRLAGPACTPNRGRLDGELGRAERGRD